MLLSKLLYMFEADTKDVEAGTKRAEKGADDLTKSMKKAEAQAKKTGDTLATFAKGALGWLAAAASASKVMGMAVSRAGEVAALDQLAGQLGASISQTDALSRSIVDLGGNTAQANRDLSNLAYGLRKDGIEPMQGMLDMADQLAGMDYGQAAAKLKEYRITDKATIDLMRKGRDEIERTMKAQMRSGAITEEAAEKARRFNDSLNKLKGIASDSANSFIQWLMPALTNVVDWLAKAGEWANKNKHFIIGFFLGIAGVVATVFGPAMWTAAAATVAATWPFIALGAALFAAGVAFAAIYDDIMTFIDGGESMIGMVLDKFPIVGDIAKWLWEVMQMAFDGIVIAGKTLWNAQVAMAEGIVGIFKWLWEVLQKYLGWIGSAIEKVRGAFGWVAGKLGFGDDDVAINTLQQSEHRVSVGYEQQDEPAPYRADARQPDPYRADVEQPGPYHIDMEQPEPPHIDLEQPAPYRVDVEPPELKLDINTIRQAQYQIDAAGSSPAAQITSGGIRNAATAPSVEQNLAIGEITIETQSTDAQGMAGATRSELQDQLQRMQSDNATALAR